MSDERLSAEQPLLEPDGGEAVHFAGIGARFLVDGALSGGAFSLVEHPIEPRTLAAPMHTHSREDEYSFVLEGEVGYSDRRAGDHRARGRPRVQAARGAARLLERDGQPVADPGDHLAAGFERYFVDMAGIMNRPGPPDFEALADVRERYALETDLESMGELIARYGLRPPG